MRYNYPTQNETKHERVVVAHGRHVANYRVVHASTADRILHLACMVELCQPSVAPYQPPHNSLIK
jgi:hypothetical protein